MGILFSVEWASFLGSSGHPFCVKHHWGAVRWPPPEGFQRGRVGILRVLRSGLQMKSRTFVSRRVVRMVPRQRIDCGGLWDVGGGFKTRSLTDELCVSYAITLQGL